MLRRQPTGGSASPSAGVSAVSAASAPMPTTSAVAPTSAFTSTTYDRGVPPHASQVSESAFALLFAEVVRYQQLRVDTVAQLEANLAALGFEVGRRAAELAATRDRPDKRELRMVAALQFVTSTCWTAVYGATVDALERSTESNDTFLVHERDPVPCRYASVPKDMGALNLAAFNAGLVRGMLDAQGFFADVTAHQVEQRGVKKTVYVVKFAKEHVDREAR